MPRPQHTDKLTKQIERNFYLRCPPEQRPKEFRDHNPADTRDASPHPGACKTSTTNTLADDELADEKAGTAYKVAETFTEAKKGPAEGKSNQKYDSSLFKTIHKTFFWRWWIGGFLKLFAGVFRTLGRVTSLPILIDTLKTTTPLLNKVLLTWLTDSFIYYKLGSAAAAAAGIVRPQGIGYGVGLAFALFVMQGACH